jgi:hypothetical protein
VGEFESFVLKDTSWALPDYDEEVQGLVSRVELEYEDPDVSEAVSILWLWFAEAPSFRRCVAQVAHGSFPEGEQELQTLLSLTPLGVRTPYVTPRPLASVLLEFFDGSGTPMPLQVDGEVGSEFNFIIQGLDSRVVQTTGSISDLDVGYACATANYPLELAAVYRILDSNGVPESEAGIESAKPGRGFVGPFQRQLDGDTNTAVALANTSDHETTATISFFLAPFTTFESGVVLGPGEHGAWFVDELSEELAGRDAEGSVEVISEEPLVGTLLRTIRGKVSASLPLHPHPAFKQD